MASIEARTKCLFQRMERPIVPCGNDLVNLTIVVFLVQIVDLLRVRIAAIPFTVHVTTTASGHHRPSRDAFLSRTEGKARLRPSRSAGKRPVLPGLAGALPLRHPLASRLYVSSSAAEIDQQDTCRAPTGSNLKSLISQVDWAPLYILGKILKSPYLGRSVPNRRRGAQTPRRWQRPKTRPGEGICGCQVACVHYKSSVHTLLSPTDPHRNRYRPGMATSGMG